jgi:hypothetical protein
VTTGRLALIRVALGLLRGAVPREVSTNPSGPQAILCKNQLQLASLSASARQQQIYSNGTALILYNSFVKYKYFVIFSYFTNINLNASLCSIFVKLLVYQIY